jgi:hypothetical protein
LFAAAEERLPAAAGSWPQWRDWHGIEVRYRAWRGPLRLEMRGGVLQAQAHVRYQVQARKGLLGGLEVAVGCGVEEPPRQALIGLLVRLDWTPDWALRPRFRVLPTRFLDRCEVTVADIDVSPLVGRVFEARLKAAVRHAMADLAPRIHHLRDEAARAWKRLQIPRELIPGLWLHIRPHWIALAPPMGDGSQVQSALWLAFQGRLSSTGAPAGAPTPLPPLLAYRPARPGLSLAVDLALDYPSLSAALGERLIGQTLRVEDRAATIEALALAARGRDLVLSAELGGDLAGRLKIIARPAFDPASQALQLDRLEFVFDPADPEVDVLARMFYIPIRERIEAEANALLAGRTRALGDGLNTVLSQILPPNLPPDLSGLRFAELDIGVGQGGLGLTGLAEGSLVLGPVAGP